MKEGSGREYRVENIMSYVLKDTKFVAKISYEMFLKVLSYGLTADENQDSNVSSVKFGDLEEFMDDVKLLKSAELEKN